LDERLCADRAFGPGSENQKGKIAMTIDWQLYSRLQKQVLLTVRTTGAAELENSKPGGFAVLLNDALSANVKQLANSPDLRKLLSGAPRAETQTVQPTPNTPIHLMGAAAATARSVDSAVSSVVLVRLGGDWGSGALVSNDGYIVTAAHVVGDATSVKIRWSDDVETLGTVVRVSKGRDVALIKTEPHGRLPLGLRRDPPQVGDPVFAIGALYEQKFQGTVTRGVVSAERVFDGYAYLQSDVTVAPGASGGPLLDAQGRIVGLTVKGLAPTGAPAGVNLFVPTRDVIDFLSLDVR
jgi:serine protease Do